MVWPFAEMSGQQVDYAHDACVCVYVHACVCLDVNTAVLECAEAGKAHLGDSLWKSLGSQGVVVSLEALGGGMWV
jgi:hypothetical protein